MLITNIVVHFYPASSRRLSNVATQHASVPLTYLFCQQIPSLGRSGTGLHRLLNSTFSDGIFSPRLLDSRGSPLPSARFLSSTLLATDSNPDGRVAVTLPVFGEFLSHDLQQTGVFRLDGDRPLDCCAAAERHPQCLPVAVRADDPVFGASGRRCLSVARSLPAPERQCLSRPAAPLSKQTSFLDGSGLYGATAADTRRLREMDGGRLRSNGDRLPSRGARNPAENTDSDASLDERNRRRRDAFGNPGVGFPDDGMLGFPRNPFGTQFGGVLQEPLSGPFGPFGGPPGLPADLLQNRQFGFGNDLLGPSLLSNSQPELPPFREAPHSQVLFSNGYITTSTKIQHPSAGSPLGKTLSASFVNKANVGNEYKYEEKKHPYPDSSDEFGTFPSHHGSNTFSLDFPTRRGDQHPPAKTPSRRYGSPKGHEGPPKKSKHIPTKTETPHFPKFNEDFDRPFSDRRPDASFSPFENQFLGRIVAGGPENQPLRFSPASQPLSHGPQRASEDEVEVLFDGQTLADNVRSGGISSRLQAPGPVGLNGVPADPSLTTTKVDQTSFANANTDVDVAPNAQSDPSLSSPDVRVLQLPTDQSCSAECRDCTCFDAGNHRANEQPHGTLLHTVWLREHNRVAGELAKSHSDWDDERLFQEARRVVVAQLQHITFNEFVPTALGYEYAAKRGLLPISVGFSPLYDASVDPRAAVEFSTAAFRAGHSKLQSMLRLVSRSGQVSNAKLSDATFNPAVLVDEDFFVKLARGMIDQPAEGTDANFAASLHGQMGGADLPTLTVQRGRDHGLATYPSAVQLCHGSTLASWDDFSRYMEPEKVDALRAAYTDPADVDLYIGGMLERHADGADLGPTFQCLVGDMFYRLRVGDRFFYDNAAQRGTFSESQLKELRKASMARLLCDNVGGDFDGVQPMAMLRPDERENPIVSCSSQALPKVDLSIF